MASSNRRFLRRFAQPFFAPSDRLLAFFGARFLGAGLRFFGGFRFFGAFRFGAIGFDLFLARLRCGVRARVDLLRRFLGFRFLGICRRLGSVQYLLRRPALERARGSSQPPLARERARCPLVWLIALHVLCVSGGSHQLVRDHHGVGFGDGCGDLRGVSALEYEYHQLVRSVARATVRTIDTIALQEFDRD